MQKVNQTSCRAERIVNINNPQEIKFLSNKISTSKYNVFSFFPKFIYEQASKYSNIFFFMIVLLQQLPDVSPTGRFTTMVPWIIILSVSAVKEIIEDIICWKNVQVGDIVKIVAGELFPADLLLLSSSEPNSICYIQTSNLDGETNLKVRQILLLFLILLVICLISTIAAVIWLKTNAESHWYLELNDLGYSSIGYIFLTFIILYNNLIPISLQVTLELVKFLQAYFINNDADMYDEENDFPAMARTSNLNEELGQISYVFSDKTGTLTRNQMEFKRCSIAGICYGSGNLEKFNAYELIKNLKTHETREYIEEFLNVLSTCHTVIPERNANDEYNYQASSPDEGAIVQSLQCFDIVFDSRTPSTMAVKFLGENRYFEVLNVLEFNSVRKRVSVILRDQHGRLKLYCKGADNVIIPRLSIQQAHKDKIIEHLEEFAHEGFRTLLVSYKLLDEETYAKWNRIYFEAATSLVDREKNLDKVAELIEHDMTLLGATAIEDKLQAGVPETISMMKTAGIKVWVLTGDKIETAVNIGYSCKLLTEQSYLIYLTADNIDVLRSTIVQHCYDYDDINRNKVSLGLIIDANAMGLILKDKCSTDLLKLAKNADTVICCRATPKNKADVVEFVKSNTDCITLAVGDGANDVGMIQAAHVGVGIYGKEGLQALSASDYAIGQFRFLQKLLFVHGIWNYKRLCKVILYSFYKNICLYVIELWFAFANGFSGQILFERWLIGLYNVLFTAAPPLALGLFDRPLQASTMLKNPKLYRITQSKSDFNMKIFWLWMLNSVLHSILLYYMCYGALKHDTALSNGTVGDYLFMGNHVYTYCVVVVCLKSGLESESWTVMTFLSIFGSIGFWFVFLVVYSKTWPIVLIGADMSGMAANLLQCAIFWFGLIFVPLFVLLPDVTYKTIQRTVFKTLDQEVQEKEKENIDPSTLVETTFSKKARDLRTRFVKSFSKSKGIESVQPTYRGYAFSQEEHGVVSQADLVRRYDSNVNKPLGD